MKLQQNLYAFTLIRNNFLGEKYMSKINTKKETKQSPWNQNCWKL